MKLPRSRLGKCRSFVHCSGEDETACLVLYEWHRAERETPTCPGTPQQIEILQVIVDGVDVYDTHEGHEDCEAVWHQAIWENVALWMDWLDGEREAADARRRKVRIEIKRGDE
jgi:hypothetical protein